MLCLTNVKSGRGMAILVLDELDRRILRALQKDPRASYRSIARSAGTTPPTAIARTKRLMDLGAIQGFQTVVAPWADENPLPALSMGLREGGPRCHQCRGPLPEAPVEQRIAGHHHVFCCTVCRDTMVDRSRRHLPMKSRPLDS